MTKDKKNITFPSGFFTIVRPEVTPSKNPDDKIIPIKLHPIDNPTNKPLLNFPKLLVSFPEKNVNTKYNRFPKTIRNVPAFSWFILNASFFFYF